MSDERLQAAARAWAEDAVAFGIEDVLVDRAAAPAESLAAPTDSPEKIAAEIAACTRCGLAETRNRVVPGQGSVEARIMFVGEAPGADEDAQGLAFVGRAGQLLTKMIGAMGFDREQVFIANILKCRPPSNRNPRPDEVACCLPFLKRQIARIRPEILVALGGIAMKNLLETEASVGSMRGRVHDYDGTPLVVTYHPAYLLRSPDMKRMAWDDLKLALRTVGLKPPRRQ
ncbi:MAG: hypothetical protein CMJ83_05615 [Planctomycetes bacterium]|nr:hypothetical protein [Planctomycetota bacterium]